MPLPLPGKQSRISASQESPAAGQSAGIVQPRNVSIVAVLVRRTLGTMPFPAPIDGADGAVARYGRYHRRQAFGFRGSPALFVQVPAATAAQSASWSHPIDAFSEQVAHTHSYPAAPLQFGLVPSTTLADRAVVGVGEIDRNGRDDPGRSRRAVEAASCRRTAPGDWPSFVTGQAVALRHRCRYRLWRRRRGSCRRYTAGRDSRPGCRCRRARGRSPSLRSRRPAGRTYR